jgi:hypothetical protein
VIAAVTSGLVATAARNARPPSNVPPRAHMTVVENPSAIASLVLSFIGRH